MTRLLFGVGVYNKGKHLSRLGGHTTKHYALWSDMLRRCYSAAWHKRYPTYIGCTVSDNFKNYQYFAEWCNNQIGFGEKNYHLDKDLVLRGNKEYNEDICVFVPKEINLLLTDRRNYRGKYPIGVSLDKGGKYKACVSIDGILRHIGYYHTVDEAAKAYREVKDAHIKVIAARYKEDIDIRVYDALMEFKSGDNFN